MKTEGILTGCDEPHEWMLKIWWHYYSQTNTYPVAFCDFGMSKSARIWCEKRGTVIDPQVPKNIPVPKTDVDPKLWTEWERVYTDIIWTSREVWFQKPYAITQSPFEKTIWLDLDTFVIKPLIPLMDASDESGIAMCRCYDRSIFNSGVISFQTKLPLIQEWANTTTSTTHQFIGDQDVLNHLIQTQNFPVKDMPTIFNRRFQHGITDDTFIIHFSGAFKKEMFEKIYSPEFSKT